MNPEQIAQEAIERMNKRITNEIFLIIQNDRDLMHHYLRAIEKFGLDKLNQNIGKEVKKAYGLVNVDNREDDPSCTLIQSHQKYK